MIKLIGVRKEFLKESSFKNLFYHYTHIKTPQKITALEDVNLTIHRNSIVGIFGENGAGKTTLLKIICGIIVPDKGEVLIEGLSPLHSEARQKIGVVWGVERSFWWRLSGRENLLFFGRLYGLNVSTIEERIKKFEKILELDSLDKEFYKYSSGMRQKLNLLRALLHYPEILILDEPTLNLDVFTRKKFIDFIKLFKNKHSLTVIWVSHRLEEIKDICEEVVILSKGRIRWQGNIEEFKEKFFKKSYLIEFEDYKCKKVSSLKEMSASDINRVKKIQLQEEFVLPSRIEYSLLTTTQSNMSGKISFSKNKFLDFSKIRQNLNIALSFLKKDFKEELSYKFSFFLNILGIVFWCLSFYFISKLFSANIPQYIKLYSPDYFSFALVGIAFVWYIHASFTSFSNILSTSQVLGTLEQVLLSPLSVGMYLFSSVLWPFVFTSFEVFLYGLAGLLLGVKLSLNLAGLVGIFIIFILSIGIFSSLGIISASFIMVFKRGNPLTWIVGGITGFLSGVYFPVEILPSWLQNISFFIPLTYALQGIRYALFKNFSLLQLLSFIWPLFLFLVVLFPASIWIFKVSLYQAKKTGTLAFY